MTELLLKRIAKKPTYTIGKLYIDGNYYCDTLEDKDRGLTQDMDLNTIKSIKVKGQTAIPTGTYKVIVNWSPRFKKNLPLLVNVPGYDGIRIHAGNTDKDTEGCLLVGENKVVGKVINSNKMLGPLVNKLTIATDIKITIQ